MPQEDLILDTSSAVRGCEISLARGEPQGLRGGGGGQASAGSNAEPAAVEGAPETRENFLGEATKVEEFLHLRI